MENAKNMAHLILLNHLYLNTHILIILKSQEHLIQMNWNLRTIEISFKLLKMLCGLGSLNYII